MKPYLIIAICLLLPLTTTAKDKNKGNQLPKVTSYDREGKPLHEGVAFFISSDGDVLTTYTALQDAWSADVTDAKGKRWKVERVYGASDLYDMVKLRTDCDKANAYKLSENQPKLKDALFIVGPDGKQTRATVNESKTYEGITYYTLATPTDDSQTGCPVINDKGQVVAVIQKNAEKDKSLSYAADIAVEKELHVNALSAALTALNSIHIPKQLPDDAKQAASYLYLIAKNSTDTLTYLTGLADYIALFPKDTTGYADRATYYAQNNRFDLAEADYDAALKNVSDQSAVHYSLSKLIYQLNMYKSYQQYKDWDLNRALSEAQTAQQLSPGILNQLQVGNCHYALKQYQQALDNYQAVNATPAASPQTFFYAAKSREMLDNDSTAVLALLDSAMSRFHEPYNSEAAPFLYQRAQYRAKYGQYRPAAMDYHNYELLVGTARLNDTFFYEKEQVDLLAHQYPWALEDIDKALRIKPNEYIYLVEKAIVQLRVGNFDEATYAAQQAIKQNPQGADAYKVLGIVAGEQGKKAEALRHLQRAKELGDTQAEQFIKQLK